ncbi:unnamed protein product (macronuclear) [Paramecium tetraurelia]|uniref:Uncharacterized protein n=1 Tax=Paramecium tetraurelia TaxID=5888 RepID=A0CMB7_PARTE|nr:uncharacterized protein GSPATT00008413001 [Paramecium tetraurelia]CAK71934.1 unnamed protein product [Paramecium tetraurelia]|eukprot:XP_001439331.1 hypothetical protein (macronuclear) [Paramecium tetraurelia strain d4-2]
MTPNYIQHHFYLVDQSMKHLLTSDSKQIVYSDIGLSEVRTNCTKLKNFQDLEQRNISVKEMITKQANWRPFIEFQDKSDEMVVTIEYCTNCKEHQRSTRHNEEQYLSYALLIKQSILLNYPDIKVYLKPLVFDNDKTITSLFLQRRIGAFEVQFQANGQQSQLFSKLQSKSWPNVNDILKAIHQQFKKTNLLIQLVYNDGDANLKGINVTMQSIQNKQLASSQHLRPQSRLSENRSCKSTSLHRQRALSQQSNIVRYSEKSDSQGRVLFLNLPIDRYEISIQESTNNQLFNEVVTLQELVRTDGAYHQIKLSKPKLALLRVEVVGPQQQTDVMVPFTDTQVHIIQNQERMLLKEISDCSGIYEGSLDPGRYTLVVSKYGFESVQQFVELSGGNNTVKIQITTRCTEISTLLNQNTNQTLINSSFISKKKKTIKPPQQVNLKILSLLEVGQMYVFDYFSEQIIGKAKIIITDSISNKIITCTTNSQGHAKLLFNYLNKGTIKVEHEEFYTLDMTYGVNEEVDLKSSRNTFKLIKKTNILSIISDNNIEIYQNDQRIRKQLNHSNICFFEISSDHPQLLYIIIENQKFQELLLKVLLSEEVITIKQPDIDLLTFPQFWILGICGKSDCQLYVINEIVSHLEFRNFYDDLEKHNQNVTKVFSSDCYQTQQKLIWKNQFIDISKLQIVDVLPNCDEQPIIFTNQNAIIEGNSIQLGSFSQEQQCNIILTNQQVMQQQPFKNSNALIIKVQIIHKDIYVYYESCAFVAIYDSSLKQKGYAKLDSYHCQDFETNQLVAVGQSHFTLYQLQITTINPQLSENKLKRLRLIKFTFWQGRWSIINLQLQFIRIRSSETLNGAFKNQILARDNQIIYLLEQDEEKKYYVKNQIQIFKKYILYMNPQETCLQVLTNSHVLYYNDISTHRQYKQETDHSRLILIGSTNSYAPKCYYKNRQETTLKLENDIWYVDLLDENVRFGLQVKGHIQGIKILLQSKYCVTDLGDYKIKRSKGLWMFGFLTYNNQEHKVHTIENQFQDEQQFQYEIVVETEHSSIQDDNLFIHSTQEGFSILNTITTQKIQDFYLETPISLLKLCNNTLIIGLQNGKVQLYKKESQQTYFKYQELQISDKNIIDVQIMDSSLLISTEDKKLIMLSIPNEYKIEYQETFDKSYINNIILYNKNQMLTTQVDGRLRLWKRERQGQSFQLNQTRTIQAMKQISKIQQVPWETQNVLVGGDTLILLNAENGKQIKQYTNSSVQQNKIVCIQCIWNNIILSGNSNGQVIKQNYGNGELLQVIVIEEGVKNLFVNNQYFLIHSNKKLYVQ